MTLSGRCSAVRPPDLVSLFVSPLNTVDARYMVTGAVAAVIYGEPRLTRDIDMVLEIGHATLEQLRRAFDARDYYLPPSDELARQAARQRDGHFSIIHHRTALKADIYLAGEDPLHAWGLERSAPVAVGDVQVWTAPLEYVVLRKLEWHKAGGSAKHLDDVRSMLRISGTRLRRAELESWIARLRLEDQWAAAEATG